MLHAAVGAFPVAEFCAHAVGAHQVVQYPLDLRLCQGKGVALVRELYSGFNYILIYSMGLMVQ